MRFDSRAKQSKQTLKGREGGIYKEEQNDSQKGIGFTLFTLLYKMKLLVLATAFSGLLLEQLSATPTPVTHYTKRDVDLNSMFVSP